VLKNNGAEAWDLGDGVLGVTFKSKEQHRRRRHSMLNQAADKAEREFRASLLYNQGEHFCVGANLFWWSWRPSKGSGTSSTRHGAGSPGRTVQRLKYAPCRWSRRPTA
jgi:3-hydroxyacyl-CoA dehydrogenase